MRIVVDTNIIFSALINPNSLIGDLILSFQDPFTFYAPQLLLEELEKYSVKLEKASKLNQAQIKEASKDILNKINLVTEELISESSWVSAYGLTKDVDEDDTPFVALALELNANLWTGDKKLSRGLKLKNSNIILTTEDINKIVLGIN